MPDLTPQQQRLRDRLEGIISAMAPVLDLVLAAGDRVSRIVEPEEHEYRPVRRAGERALLEAPRDTGGTGRSGEVE